MSVHIFKIFASLTVFSSLYLTNASSDYRVTSSSIFSNSKEDVLTYSNGYGLHKEFFNQTKNVEKQLLDQIRPQNDAYLSTINSSKVQDKSTFYNYMASQILKYGGTKLYDRNNATRVLDLKFVDGNLNITETLSNGTKFNSVMKGVHRDNIISYLKKSIFVIEIEKRIHRTSTVKITGGNTKHKNGIKLLVNGEVRKSKEHKHPLNFARRNIGEDDEDEFKHKSRIEMGFDPPGLLSRKNRNPMEGQKGFGDFPVHREDGPNRERQSEEGIVANASLLLKRWTETYPEQDIVDKDPDSRLVEYSFKKGYFGSDGDMKMNAYGVYELYGNDGKQKYEVDYADEGLKTLKELGIGPGELFGKRPPSKSQASKGPGGGNAVPSRAGNYGPSGGMGPQIKGSFGPGGAVGGTGVGIGENGGMGQPGNFMGGYGAERAMGGPGVGLRENGRIGPPQTFGGGFEPGKAIWGPGIGVGENGVIGPPGNFRAGFGPSGAVGGPGISIRDNGGMRPPENSRGSFGLSGGIGGPGVGIGENGGMAPLGNFRAGFGPGGAVGGPGVGIRGNGGMGPPENFRGGFGPSEGIGGPGVGIRENGGMAPLGNFRAGFGPGEAAGGPGVAGDGTWPSTGMAAYTPPPGIGPQMRGGFGPSRSMSGSGFGPGGMRHPEETFRPHLIMSPGNEMGIPQAGMAPPGGGLRPPGDGMIPQWGQSGPAGNMMSPLPDIRREGDIPVEQVPQDGNSPEKMDEFNATIADTSLNKTATLLNKLTHNKTGNISVHHHHHSHKIPYNIIDYFELQISNSTSYGNRIPIWMKPVLRVIDYKTTVPTAPTLRTDVIIELGPRHIGYSDSAVTTLNAFVSKMMETYSGYFTTFAALVTQYLSQKSEYIASKLIRAFSKEFESVLLNYKLIIKQFGKHTNKALEDLRITLRARSLYKVINNIRKTNQCLNTKVPMNTRNITGTFNATNTLNITDKWNSTNPWNETDVWNALKSWNATKFWNETNAFRAMVKWIATSKKNATNTSNATYTNNTENIKNETNTWNATNSKNETINRNATNIRNGTNYRNATNTSDGTLCFDVNTLLSFIDSLYIPFDPSKLALVAELIHEFPNKTKYGYTARYIVGEVLKEAFLHPLIKLEKSVNKKLLITAVTSFLNKHYKERIPRMRKRNVTIAYTRLDKLIPKARLSKLIPKARLGKSMANAKLGKSIANARLGESVNKTLLKAAVTTSLRERYEDRDLAQSRRDNVTIANARRAGRLKKDSSKTVKQTFNIYMKLKGKKPNRYYTAKRHMRSTLTTRLQKYKKKQHVKYDHPKVYDKYLQHHTKMTTVHQHDRFEKHVRKRKNRKGRVHKLQQYSRVRENNLKGKTDNRGFHKIKRTEDKHVTKTLKATTLLKTMTSRAPKSYKHLTQKRKSKRQFNKLRSIKGSDDVLAENENAKPKHNYRNGKVYRVVTEKSAEFEVWHNDDEEQYKSNILKQGDFNNIREQENNDPQDIYNLSLGQSLNVYIERTHKIEPYLTLEKTEQNVKPFDSLKQNNEKEFSGFFQGTNSYVGNTKTFNLSPNDLLSPNADVNYHQTTSMVAQMFTTGNPNQERQNIIGSEIFRYTIVGRIPDQSSDEPKYRPVRRSRKRKNKRKNNHEQILAPTVKLTKLKPTQIAILINKTERIEPNRLHIKHKSKKVSNYVRAEDKNTTQTDNFRNGSTIPYQYKEIIDNSDDLDVWHNEDEETNTTKHSETSSPVKNSQQRKHNNVKGFKYVEQLTVRPATFVLDLIRTTQKTYNNESEDKSLWKKVYEIENQLDLNIPSRRRSRGHKYPEFHLERMFRKTHENPPWQTVEEKVNNPNIKRLFDSSSYSDEEYTLKLNLEDAMSYPDRAENRRNHNDKNPVQKSIGISSLAKNNRDRSNKTLLIKKIFDYIEEHENISE